VKHLLPIALACACATDAPTKTQSSEEPIVIEGEAFSLILEPVMPSGQESLLGQVGVLEIQLTQGDGTTSTYPLSGVDEDADSQAVLPPLVGATIRLVGRNGARVILSGQTPPIDLIEGELVQPLSLAKVDTLVSLPELPTGLGFAATASAPEGRYYLFGGAEEGFVDQQASSSIVVIDLGTPTDGLIPRVLDLTLPDTALGHSGRVAHTATALTADTALSGQILVAGGTPMLVPQTDGIYSWIDDALSSNQAFVFDPETETLTQTEDMNLPRYGHTAVVNHLGHVVIIGGFNDTELAFSQAYAEVFDPEDASFKPVNELMLAGTAYHAAARRGEQGVMSCGGLNYAKSASTECTLISPDRAVATLDFPGLPTIGPSMVTMSDERILFTGGLDMTDQDFAIFTTELSASNQAWVFQSGSWQPAGEMVHPRAWHAAAPLSDGRVLISGGVSRIHPDDPGPAGLYWGGGFHPGAAIPCAEIFDPDTLTFEELHPCLSTDTSGSLPQPLLLQGIATDPVHGALMIGGVIGESGLGAETIMLYRPLAD
jgi:hypothetical protein